VRVASWGENSTLSVYFRARLTPSTDALNTSSGVIRSIFSMWIADVDMKTWIRNSSAAFRAS
jgi:hypothetical protein